MSDANSAPGQSHRTGISLVQAVRKFSDEHRAERWFINARWADGVICPHCESDKVSERPTRKPQPYRCRACRKDFSVKTGTVMQGSNLKLGTWALAAYILTTNIKGVSSMKLHRDLGITQKTAWHLAHRIRESWEDGTFRFGGTVEIDEAYIGGKDRNRHEWKVRSGRGPKGKTAVVGMKERESNEVRAKVVEAMNQPMMRDFISTNIDWGATVYTDEAQVYRGTNRNHESVQHSVKEYVRGNASINGMESLWASLKRGYNGIYHHFSAKHLQRYVKEFSGRHNARPRDTEDQLKRMVAGMSGKRLRYCDLIA